MAEKAVHVLIGGRVQGVWFRSWIMQEASARGLGGWVRNRSDGRVEAVFVGPVGSVDGMLALCWQGPPAARVTDVAVSDTEASGESGFRQRATF